MYEDQAEVPMAAVGGMISKRDITRPTVTQKIDREVELMTSRLEELKSLQAKLDANPEFKDILDTVAKLGLRY